MARESDRIVPAPISQLRQRLGRSSGTAFVLSGGGNQAVAQVGMLRALLERDIVPDVIIGMLRRCVQRRRSRPRRASAASNVSKPPGRCCAGTRSSRAARSRRAWNLLTRDDHLFSNQGLRDVFLRGDTPTTFAELAMPAAGRRRRPRHRRGGGVRPRTAAAGAPRQRRAPRDLPADRATTAAPWSTARSSTPCRCGTRSPGRSTGSTCSTWPATSWPGPCAPHRRRGPGLRHQPQAALRARAAQRPRRRGAGAVLPAPARRARAVRLRRRSLMLIDDGARRSPTRPSTTPRRPQRRRRQLRRSWWRRDDRSIGTPRRRPVSEHGCAVVEGQTCRGGWSPGPSARTPRARCRARVTPRGTAARTSVPTSTRRPRRAGDLALARSGATASATRR